MENKKNKQQLIQSLVKKNTVDQDKAIPCLTLCLKICFTTCIVDTRK